MNSLISMELSQDNLKKNLIFWENLKIRERFKTELFEFFQAYIEQNRAFSRVDFLQESIYNVFFIPTSESYNLLGEYVTVINVPAEYVEEVIGFNMNQDTNSNLVKKFAIIHGEEESREIVTFDVRDVYEINGF